MADVLAIASSIPPMLLRAPLARPFCLLPLAHRLAEPFSVSSMFPDRTGFFPLAIKKLAFQTIKLYYTTMSKTMSRTSHDAFLLISDLWRALRCCQQDETFCAGLTFGQFRILDAVADRGRLKLSDLHDFLAVDKSTTTRLIRPLAQRKLITQERSHADSRAVELKLTDQGKMIHRRVQDCFEKFSEAVQAKIPAKERGRVYSGARLFAQALQQACNGSSLRRSKQCGGKVCHGRRDNRNTEKTT